MCFIKFSWERAAWPVKKLNNGSEIGLLENISINADNRHAHQLGQTVLFFPSMGAKMIKSCVIFPQRICSRCKNKIYYFHIVMTKIIRA